MQEKIEQATPILNHIAGFLDAEGLKDYYFIVKADGSIKIHFDDPVQESVFKLKYSIDTIIEYIIKQATK